MSNAAKIEALMKSMQYSAEKIAEVLATLSTKKKVQSDDTIEESILAKKCCEAHLISKLLEEKEVEEAEMKAERAAAGKKTKPAAAKVETPPKPSEPVAEKASKPTPGAAGEKALWPEHKDTALDDVPDIPKGCKLRQYVPAIQSPYWRGELPVGETHHGKASRTRSYQHSAGIGAAKFTSDQARAAVVAWLWEWHDQAKSSASSSGGTVKKLKST